MKKFIILTALLLAGCGGSPESVNPIQTPTATPEPLTPQSVAEQYLTAAQAGDIPKILDRTCFDYIPELPTPQQWKITGLEPTTDSKGSYLMAIAIIDGQQWGIEVWESEALYQVVLRLSQKRNENRPALGIPLAPLPERTDYSANQYCIRDVKRL